MFANGERCTKLPVLCSGNCRFDRIASIAGITNINPTPGMFPVHVVMVPMSRSTDTIRIGGLSHMF